MTMNSPDEVWSRSARLFHWLIAALILVQGTIGLIMVELPKRPNIIPVYTLHKSIGLTILLLAILRLGFRFIQKRPDILPLPGWQDVMARITHVTLYVLIFAIPISGWLFDSASSLRPLYWWWWLKMPKLTDDADKSLAELSRNVHEALFWVLVVVVALHVAGALKHHFIDRDSTLRRMLPWAARRVKQTRNRS